MWAPFPVPRLDLSKGNEKFGKMCGVGISHRKLKSSLGNSLRMFCLRGKTNIEGGWKRITFATFVVMELRIVFMQ